MTRGLKIVAIIFIIISAFILSYNNLPVADDRYELRAPNGISFSEIRGYENFQVVAPSYRPDRKEIRYILGNRTVIEAYKKGIPENGQPFPDGSIIVKIAYSERKNPAFPAALEPDVLQRVEFMIKDSKRFKDTGGWGYARFLYDEKSKTFKPYGKDPDFHNECFQCHTIVKDRDFVFTKYFER